MITVRRGSSGWVVRRLRAQAGLSQRELATRLARPQPMIARWERGHDAPRLDALVDVARACGYELDLVLRPRDEVDRAQIREHLQLSPLQRLHAVENVSAFVTAAQRR